MNRHVPKLMQTRLVRLVAPLIIKSLLLVAMTLLSPNLYAAFTYQLNDGFEASTLQSPWGVELSKNANVTIQTSIVRAGTRAVSLVNNYSDAANQRTEMTAGPSGHIDWDQEYWIGFSFYLKNWAPSVWPEIIHQFHAVPNDGDWSNCVSGRNITTLMVVSNIMYLDVITEPLTGPAPGGANGDHVWSETVQPNTWYDWVMHIRPSLTSSGIIEIWKNGTLIYQQYGPNSDPKDSCNLDSDPLHYYKVGVYNWPWVNGNRDVTTREIIYDEVKIGRVGGGYTGGYAGVVPGGAAGFALPAGGATPSGVAANPASMNQIYLSWMDNCNNETGFKIERKTGSSGTYSQIATRSANTMTFTDTGLSPGTTYFYRVRAYNASYDSGYSSEVSATTSAGGTLISENFSSSAANFTVVRGTWAVSNAQYVVTGIATNTHNASLSIHNTVVPGDFILTADCQSVGTSGIWDDFKIVFNYQDINNHYFVNFAETDNTSWGGVFKMQGGLVSPVGNWTNTFAPNTFFAIKVQREGSTIKVFSNNVLIMTCSDSTFTGGKVGLGSDQPTTGPKLAKFDNLVVQTGTFISENFSINAANFTVVRGTWAVSNAQYVVTGNATNTHNASLSLHNTPVPGNFTLTADCQSVGTTSTWDNSKIVFNYQDANNHYFVNFLESDNSLWGGVFKVQGGLVDPIGNWTSTFAPNTSFAIKIRKIGSTIKVYSNNVLIMTSTDSAFTGGKVGLGVDQPTVGTKLAKFDNLIVTSP